MGWEIFGPPAPRKPLLPTLGAPKNPESGYGPWETTASPLVQRRRKPDGSYETRATPGAVPGGKLALGKVEQPDTSARAIAASGLKLFGASVLDNITSAPEQMEAALEAPRTLIRKAVRQEPIATRETATELLRGPEKSTIRDQPYRQTLRERHQQRTGEFAEATEGLGSFPIAELPFVGEVRLPIAPTLYAGVELGAGLVDPTNLPAAGPLKPASATREAVDLLDGITFKALDDADLRAALQKGVQPVSPGYGGSAEAFRFAAWLDKHGLDYDAAQRFGELPWLREKFFNLDNPDATPPPSFYGAKPGEAGHIRNPFVDAPPMSAERSLARFGSPVVWRETDAEGLRELLNLSEWRSPRGSIDVATSRDLALGQGSNRGVVVEMDPSLLTGAERTNKPGLVFSKSEGLGTELVAQPPAAYPQGFRDQYAPQDFSSAVRAVEIPKKWPNPFERNLGRNTRQQLLEAGWRETDLGDSFRLEREYRPGSAVVNPESGHITFGRDPDPDVDLGAMEAPELPSAPSGPVRDPQMSTKALENVAGMQDEFAELVANNYGAVARSRGPTKSVSVYHDAAALRDELGLTPEEFMDLAPRLGDEEVSLGRHYIGGVKQEINGLARQLADGSAPDPVAAKAKLEELNIDLLRMASNIMGRFSEAGRTLRSGQEALAPFAAGTSSRQALQLRLLRRYRKNMDDESIALLSRLSADPRSPDMLNFLRKMERPTFKDYRMSYWINSVLSGTKTTLRNLNGNVVRLAEQTAMRPVGAVVEGILAPLQGRAPERLMRETLPATMGVFRGVPEGLKRFAFVMKNGYDPERLVAELTEGAGKKFDGRLPVDPFLLSQSPAVRGVGAVVTLPTRLLSATDALFKTMASTSENYAWATRKAIQEGADDVPGRVAELVLEQPEEMVQAARAFAEKATFQDPMSWVGSAAASLRRGPPGTDKLVNALEDRGGVGRALVPLLRAPQTVMEHLLPFIHVSDRVAASVTDYIPGSKPRKLAYLLATKDPEAADLIARQVVGAGLGMLGLKWAAEGRLVGAAPKDEALRNDFYSEGKQPYSLLIGGRWVPIRDTLGPLAGPFVAAALYQDHVQAREDPVPATVGMTLSSARYMLDASYMSTLQDVIEAIETDNSGEVGRTQAAARVVGGYNPYSGLQRNVATALDPRVVERESFTDELKSGVPGLRSELPARIGPRGEELTQTTGALGGVSPVVPTRNRVADPELAERVERLRYTLQGMRRQYGRTEKAIDNAERGAAGEAGLAGKDEQLRARAQQLRGQLPPVGDPTAAIDATMDDVRDLENTIRDIRANPNLDDATKREREIYWQQRLELLLQQTIEQLQGGTIP